MKFRIIVVLCCVGLTIWQLPNLVYLWRQYQSAKLIQRGGEWGLPSVSQPVFPLKVEHVDPEAADMANYLLSSDVDVNEISNLILKYPDNDLLISKLLHKVLLTDGLDPGIADLLADRLLESQPENAHFHYLKAYVQAHTTSFADFDKVLENIEKGNKCELLSFPHYTYHNRILALFEKANLNPSYFNIRLIPYEFQGHRQLVRRLEKQAIQAFTSGERDYGLRILNAGSGMTKKYFDNSRSYLELVVGTNTLRSITCTELQYAGLSPNQARDVRFHLSRLITCTDILREKVLGYNKQKIILCLLIGIGTLAGWLTVSIFLLCLTIFLINLISKTPKSSKVGLLAYILFFVCLLFFLLAIVVVAFFSNERLPFTIFGEQTKPNLHLPLSLISVSVFLWLTFWLMDFLKPYRKVSYSFTFIKSFFSIAFCIALVAVFITTLAYDFSWRKALVFCIYSIGISAFLWAILMYGWWIIRHIPYRWLTTNRIIQLLLITTFFAGVFNVSDIVWLGLLLSVLLIASISLIIVHPPLEKLPSLVAGWIQIFGKSENIAASRRKILSLLSPYLVIFFFCFLISAYFGSDLIREQMANAKDELVDFGPLPPPNRQTYDSMVDRIMTGQISTSDSIGYLHMIEPNDLLRVLIAIKDADPDRIENYRLCDYIKRSTPDVQNIFLGFLDDPNSEDDLICRAEAGDRTVKSKLLLLLKEKRAAFEEPEGEVERSYNHWDQPRLGDCFRIAGALSYISEPNESLERFLDLVEKSDLIQIDQGIICSIIHPLYDGLTSLPGKHATTVLKAYLNKTDYSDLRPVKGFSWLPETLSQFADSDTAEDVFRIMCQNPPMAKPSDTEIKGANLPIVKAIKEIFSPSYEALQLLKAISPYFDMDSINTLKDGLENSDENLHAYAVWQLTRIGYEWTKDEVESLTQDDSWKVRANIVFALDSEKAALMQSDNNNLVKLTAKMFLADRM